MGILSQATSSHMSSDQAVLPGGSPANPDPQKSSGAWLGSQSVFDRRDERKLGRAMGASMAIHGGILALILIAVAVAPAQVAQTMEDLKVVFLSEAGPGGGGGGNPAPAPVKKLEVPKTAPPKPAVVTPVPEPVAPPPPVPTLVAPVQTSAASVLQSSGTSSVSLADYGGGGRGRGVGAGDGAGLGDGKDKGFGGGAYAPGSGVINPGLLHEEKPKYTSEAMRAKIQGVVDVEAVVGENGLVTDVRIHKSLDKVFGLDLEALAAARKWRFRPATYQGKPVPFKVIIQLEFRLH